MVDYEHSTNFHKIASKISETKNLKDIENLKRKLSELEQDDEVRELIGKCDEREKEIKELIKEEKYQKAVSGYDVERDNLEDQIKSFKELIGYKDSEKYYETLTKEKEYRELVRIFDSGNCYWEYISKSFEKLDEYKDSKKYYEACQPKVEEQRKEKELQEKKKVEDELERKYQEAQKSMDEDKLDYASMIFKKLGDYKDSKHKAEECDKRIADAKEKKQKAEAKKKKTIYLILLVLFIGGLASYLIVNLINWQSDDYVHWHSVFGSTVGYADHDYELISDVPPTCTESGYKEYKCETCGRIKTERIAATGHKIDSGTVTKEPTCTESGTKVFTCPTCGAVVKTESIAAKGHTSDSGKVTKEPTCTASGTKTYTCTTCGAVIKTETIPEMGHDYTSGYCSRCGISVPYKIGEKGPAGGYVFYDCDADNDSGNADGLISTEVGWRYLEAAPADLRVVDATPTVDATLYGYSDSPMTYLFGYYKTSDSGNSLYVNGTTTYNAANCTGSAIGTGRANTQLLVGSMGNRAYSFYDNSIKTANYAARLCDSLTYTFNEVTYDDWFLPSKDELNLMYVNLHKAGLGGFSDSYYYDSSYWSSSERYGSAYRAWKQYFRSGSQSDDTRDDFYMVRPVRAF